MIKIIEENLNLIRKNIEKACNKVNKNSNDITIIGVTKTVDQETMKIAQKLGIDNFGENKVQELLDKYYSFEDIKWHQIGHLQRNKVNAVLDKVTLVHSIDSLRLLMAINNRAKKEKIVMDVLVQVNVAREQSKYGFLEEEINDFMKEASKLENILIKGLMTIAPYTNNPEDNRIHFKSLKKLFDTLRKEKHNNVNMEILSMGMTNDYEVAIEEGANMIRIGTGIFGKR